MDKMIAEIKKEQQEEVKFKANCLADLKANKRAVMSKKDQSGDLSATVDKIQRRMATLRDEVAVAKANIASTKAAVKKAGNARRVDKAELQRTVADQQATQNILKKALEKLQKFYSKRSALLEVSKSSSKQRKSKGASPVMALLETIIAEAGRLENKAKDGEAAAQARFESFVNESNNVIENASQEVAQKTEKAALSDAEKGRTEGDGARADGEAEALNAYRADLHVKCDFVIKNFDKRQMGRTHTMEEIQETIATLAGMK